jgi:hypothetical protein
MRTSRQSFPNHLNVGIVGATGIVGELIRKVLDQRELPIDTLRLFASARSAGRRIHWKDKELVVEDASTASYSGLNLVFFLQVHPHRANWPRLWLRQVRSWWTTRPHGVPTRRSRSSSPR